jgi:hypothetical protein
MKSEIDTHSLQERLKEVNDIIDTCSDGTMSFEQANVIARFYYDYQDTNIIIDEAERMATEDIGRLREFAVSINAETAVLLNNIGRLDGVDFKEIANDHSKQFYSRFQEASEQLNPYWKRYSELNNRLDYLPLGSKDYAEMEKECEKAKTEHDTRQIEVKRLYAEYEKENQRAGYVFSLKASHLYALAAKMNGIAGSIINDLDRLEKGNGE